MSNLCFVISGLTGLLIFKLCRLFQVPDEIKHLPAVSVWKLLYSMVSREPLDSQYERVLKPVLDKMGCARIWMGGKWEIIIDNHEQAKEILSGSDIFCKRPVGEARWSQHMLVSKFFGKSNIVSSDGDEWLRHRQIVSPAFKRTWCTKTFGNCTIQLIDKILELKNQPLVIHNLFQRLTLDVLGLGMFSYDFAAVRKGDSNLYLSIYNDLKNALFSPIYYLFPILEKVPSRQVYHAKNDSFRSFLRNIIQNRQLELKLMKPISSYEEDLLSLMIRATHDFSSGPRLSNDEVLNDLAAFFLAGHDTTANTLTSTFYYLGKYQHIQTKLRQEILHVLGNSKEISIPTPEQLKSLKYLNCVIKESMRILTTVVQIRRHCMQTTTLRNNLAIPAHTSVTIHSWSIHHNPALFPDPNLFNPDRFLDPDSSQSRSWMAFGSGARMCIGSRFSLMEQRVTIAMLIHKFQIELGPKSQYRPHPTLSATGLVHPVNMDLQFTPRY